MGCFIKNHPFWGTPWKPTYVYNIFTGHIHIVPFLLFMIPDAINPPLLGVVKEKWHHTLSMTCQAATPKKSERAWGENLCVERIHRPLKKQFYFVSPTLETLGCGANIGHIGRTQKSSTLKIDFHSLRRLNRRRT